MAFLPEWQVEYISFIHGLVFFILATVCFSMSRFAKKQLPWIWLGLFGVMHGLGKWVLCFTSDNNTSIYSSIIVTIMVVVSFLCLAEFGRCGLVKTGKGPGTWIYVPLLFLAVLSVVGPGIAQASLLHLLGLIGGLMAALAMFLAAGSTEAPAGSWLKSGSLAMLIYALFVGLSILPKDFLAVMFGGSINMNVFSFSCQGIRLLLIIWLSAAAWSCSQAQFSENNYSTYLAARSRYALFSATILIIALCLGWTVIRHLEYNARYNLQNESGSQVASLSDHIIDELEEGDHAAMEIAGDALIAAALYSGEEENINNTNQILDRYQKVLEARVCYLIDNSGNVIASTNRYAPDSYVGHNYSFRPYFSQPMKGEAGRYFALGVTSGERGYYTSYPVRSGQGDIIGAVVIKIGSDSLEPSFRHYRLCFLTDPHGIIFFTSQPDMLYMSLRPLDGETRQALTESRQFGSSTFQPIGLQVSPNGTDLVYKGNYYLQNSSIINSEGWSAVLLTPTGEVRAAWLPGLMMLLFLSALINIFFLVMHQSIEDTALISASEENYHSIFNGVNEAIFVHEFPSGKINDINQKACDMQGFSREYLLNAQMDEVFNVPPYTAEKAITLIEKAAAGEQQLFEWQMKDTAGKLFWVEVNLKKAVLGGKERVLAVVRDISNRKQAEEALKESEDKYRTIFETTGAGTFIIGEDTIIELVNREFERLSGYTKAETEGKKSWTEFVAAEDLEMMKRYHRLRRIDQGSVPRDYEFRLIDRYGNMKYIYLSINMFPGTKKSVASLVDITERKRVERLLEEQTLFLQRLLDTIPYPVYYKNTDRLYQGCNKAFEVFAGRAKDEIIGKTVYDLFPADQASYFTSRDDELFREPGAQVYETNVTYPDGIKHDAIYNRITYANNDGSIAGLLGVIIDITERKQWQEEMARLERLNLIGEMAAGIGHEIRNPMTTVRGLLQLLKSRDEIDQHREYFDIMIEELDRANTIISEFLSLAKNKPLSKKSLNLSSIVETLFPLIYADAMQSGMFIQVEMGDIPDLLLDEKEIRQLILNLVRNGLEAMQPGGKITIETASEGQSVVLKVRDEGKGIEQDVLEKLGTPFYTTKDSGTGLGLAVCYSIATRHNAEIRIETSPAGTTFYVTFNPI